MKGFVSFGEVLLRLSSASGQRFEQAHALDVHYGGSEANVSSALARWNIPSSHVTVLPEQETGRAACQALIKAGVNTRYVRFHPGRIGIYFLEQGNAVRSPKVIYDRYHSAFSELNPADFNWKEILKDAQWFHWSGITPAISQAAADACRDAIHTARKLNIKISADINYRSILWQYGKKPIDIMPELIASSQVVVGSVRDFRNCTGINLPGDSTFNDSAEKIIKQFQQLEYIAHTNRTEHDANHHDISGALWNGHEVYYSKVYRLQNFADRIGSGDAFMAGIVYSLLNKKSPAETIEFATASAALKHTIAGDVLLASADEVEELTHSTEIGKLLR